MRAVIQRVSSAAVHIKGEISGEIQQGFLILLGIETQDTEQELDWLVRKIIGLRVFSDDKGLMNLNLEQVNGQCLVVSQFTLLASTKKGNRPSYIRSARPEEAVPLYQLFLEKLQKHISHPIQSGIFGADMQVSLTNDGPVTIIIDTRNKE